MMRSYRRGKVWIQGQGKLEKDVCEVDAEDIRELLSMCSCQCAFVNVLLSILVIFMSSHTWLG